jgi:hypothetical protein
LVFCGFIKKTKFCYAKKMGALVIMYILKRETHDKAVNWSGVGVVQHTLGG